MEIPLSVLPKWRRYVFIGKPVIDQSVSIDFTDPKQNNIKITYIIHFFLIFVYVSGAFLIPYFLTLFICGIPLVYLETTLGQFASAGCVSVFNINPLFKGEICNNIGLFITSNIYV